MRGEAEQFKQEYRQRIEYHTQAAKAWEAVAIEKKKDGKEFAQIWRAVKNAAISGGTDYNGKVVYPALNVYFTTNETRHESDELKVYYYMDELPKTDERRKERTTAGCIRLTVPMSADEIRESIRKRIEYHKAQIREYEDQISLADSVIDAFTEALDGALKTVFAACGQKRNSLYYDCIELMHKTY